MGGQTIAGVDIGGTKTHIVLACDGVRLAERVLATGSWRVREWDRDAGRLAMLVRELNGGADPAALAVGAHGCDTAAHCRHFQGRLAACTQARLEVVNDAELLVPAAGFSSGIGVIAGTGSIAVARLADQTLLVAGGWGWILGDEGSAPALVREAARAVRAGIDAGKPPDGLAEALLQAFGAKDVTEFGTVLAAAGGAAALGRHARAVFSAAEAGSPLALAVIRDAGEALARLARRLADRGAPASHLVAGGSVIVHQKLLLAAFTAALQALLPDTAVTVLRRPPVDGALALAERLLQESATLLAPDRRTS